VGSVVVTVRMHQVRVPEVVELVRVSGSERPFDLENRDTENKGEGKYVEKDSEFDDHAMLDKERGAENRNSVFEDEKAENLRYGLLSRGNEKKPRSHRGERDGNRKSRRDRFADVETRGDNEASDNHRKDDESRNREGYDRFEFAFRVYLPDGIVEKHRHCDAFNERIDGRDGEEAELRHARLPIPQEERQCAYGETLRRDYADRVGKPSRSRQGEIRKKEESENDFGKSLHGELSVEC
jgi:hypothetical protein